MSAFSGAIAFNATAVSGTTAYTSAKTTVKNYRDCSYQLDWSGTPTGTWTIWVSNKDVPIETTDADWVQLALAIAILQPAGSASKDVVDLASLPFTHVRLRYTNASGSGTITAYFAGKGL